MFCQGKLGPNSYLECAKCGQLLCKQNQVNIPNKVPPPKHELDGGYRRIDKAHIDYQKQFEKYGLKINSANSNSMTNPSESDWQSLFGVFIKPLDFMRVDIPCNGGYVICPKPNCGNRVGQVKLSGVKCGVFYQVPGF